MTSLFWIATKSPLNARLLAMTNLFTIHTPAPSLRENERMRILVAIRRICERSETTIHILDSA
ncbi:hypothetical protein ACWIUD_08010, partial [Helicobacter sp. 23-1044]